MDSQPPADPGPGSTARATDGARLMLPVALISVVSPFATDAYLSAFPAMARDLDAAPALIQATLTTFVLAFAVGQLLAGPLSDGRGRRPFVLTGCALFTVASAVCASAPDIAVLLTARAAQGLGAGAAVAVARAAVADRSSGALLARHLGALFSLLVLVPVVAPAVGAAVVHAAGWRGVFWLLTGLGALMSVTAAAALPETLPARVGTAVPPSGRGTLAPPGAPLCRARAAGRVPRAAAAAAVPA